MFAIGDVLRYNPNFDGHNPLGTEWEDIKVKVISTSSNQVYIEVVKTHQNNSHIIGARYFDPINMYVLDRKMTPSLKLFLKEEVC